MEHPIADPLGGPYGADMTYSDAENPSLIEELAVAETEGDVLSVYLLTDPRLPANTNHVPGWLVEMRNGFRELSRTPDGEGTLGDRPEFRRLRKRVEDSVQALEPAERARGVAWFLAADGSLDRRLSLQIPPRRSGLYWDRRPFVSPLVDVADRSRATGLVLVGGEAVRLLHWEAGRISEPDRSLYELELGDWRRYEAYAAPNPARGQQSATNVEALRDRVDEWRRRFLRDAATAIGARLGELGWDRVVLVTDEQVAGHFAEELPTEVSRRVVATVTANVLWAEPAAVAGHLVEELSEVWRRDGQELAERALEAAAAGGGGAIGWSEVLGCLIQHRVEHLIFGEAEAPAAEIPEAVRVEIGNPAPGMLIERATERAIESGAGVTMLSSDDAPLLAAAGGVVATLRY